MDLQTENRIAAILMKEAAELRCEAEKEGVLAYLKQPKTRFRPNSRFLSATVRGVQQANRAVEVNEMWRLRQKEIEMDNRLKGKKDESRNDRSRLDGNSPRSSGKKHVVTDDNAGPSCSRKREYESSHSREENGLRDEELEEFLHSRVKRGRGAVGPRMDETGPYLPPRPDSKEEPQPIPSVTERRVFGPERPSHKLCYSSEEELDDKRKKSKKVKSSSSKKHKSKDKSKEKKRRKEEKRRKYHS